MHNVDARLFRYAAKTIDITFIACAAGVNGSISPRDYIYERRSKG